jgi:hypothetical protein
MKKLGFLLIVYMTLCPSLLYGQPGKDAYRALKKIEAATQTGITYRDYTKLLSDAQLELNLFEESEEAKLNSTLTSSFGIAFSHYKAAGIVWKDKIDGLEFVIVYMKNPTDYFNSPGNKNRVEHLSKVFPESMKKTNEGGLIEEDSFGTGIISARSITQFLWKEASKELRKASKLLNR